MRKLNLSEEEKEKKVQVLLTKAELEILYDTLNLYSDTITPYDFMYDDVEDNKKAYIEKVDKVDDMAKWFRVLLER